MFGTTSVTVSKRSLEEGEKRNLVKKKKKKIHVKSCEFQKRNMWSQSQGREHFNAVEIYLQTQKHWKQKLSK